MLDSDSDTQTERLELNKSLDVHVALISYINKKSTILLPPPSTETTSSLTLSICETRSTADLSLQLLPNLQQVNKKTQLITIPNSPPDLNPQSILIFDSRGDSIEDGVRR